MAISHVCVQCGWDLARVRPHREPHYGLNLVRCPRCQAASVRRRHPISTGWRQFRRLDFALTMVFLRVFGIGTLTLFSVLGALGSVAFLGEIDRRGAISPEARFLFLTGSYVLLPLLLGTFLTAAFAHLPRWKVWLTWLGWMMAVLLAVSLHGPMDSVFDPRRFSDLERGGVLKWVGQGAWHIALPATVACAVMLVLAIPGVLAGRLLLRLRDVLASAKWRWRRRRLRLAAAANV